MPAVGQSARRRLAPRASLVWAALLLTPLLASAARNSAGDRGGGSSSFPRDAGASRDLRACAQLSLNPTITRQMSSALVRAGSLAEVPQSVLPPAVGVDNGYLFNSYRSGETFLVSKRGPAPAAKRPIRISLRHGGAAAGGKVAAAAAAAARALSPAFSKQIVSSMTRNPRPGEGNHLPEEDRGAAAPLAATSAEIEYTACGFGRVVFQALQADSKPVARKSLSVAYACGTSVARALAWAEKAVARLSVPRGEGGRIASVNVFFESDPGVTAANGTGVRFAFDRGTVAITKVDFGC